jgi:WD40 repeat protein
LKCAERKKDGAVMRSSPVVLLGVALTPLLTVTTPTAPAQRPVLSTAVPAPVPDEQKAKLLFQPQLVVQLGHGSSIKSVAFSPDERFVLTGSADKTAKLWDVQTGLEIRVFKGHTGDVNSVAFSADGRAVLTASDDHTAKLWDARTGQELKTFEGHSDSVKSAAFLPDGDKILTASSDKTAKLWNVRTGREIRTFTGHSDAITSAALSADGHRVVTGSLDNTAKLWNVDSGRLIRTFTGHSDWIHSVAFSTDGRNILTGSSDKTAKLWNTESGELIRTFKPAVGQVDSVAFSPDGHVALIGGGNSAPCLWDVATGQEIRFLGSADNILESGVFSHTGRTVLTSNRENVTLWDAGTGRPIRSFSGHSAQIWKAAFSPDGRQVLTGNFDNTADLWNLETGQEVRTFAGHSNWVDSIAFSPDGHRILTGSWDTTARIWDAETGREIQGFQENSSIISVAFSPNGQQVLAVTGSTADLWDVETGQKIRSVSAGGYLNMTKVALFSPKEDTFLAGTGTPEGAVRLWNAATGAEVRPFDRPFAEYDNAISSLAFSTNGAQALAGSDDKTAILWDVHSGKPLHTFQMDSPVVAVAFSPDGQEVLTAGRDVPARVWDVQSGNQIRAFEPDSSIASVSFSPDGRFVLTGNDDGTAKLWNARTGHVLCSLIEFTNGKWAVVDPEGRFDTNDLDGDAPLAWVLPDEPMHPLPIEIFMHDYYTPRLLSRIMNGETLPPIRSIAEIKNRVQPDVEIVAIGASQEHSGRVDVVVRAANHINDKGQASGLEDLHLFRDGQLVGFRAGALSNGDVSFSDIQLPTSGKSVTFTAYAFNSERIKSVTSQREFSYQPGAPAKPRAWLLQIGVNHYLASNCELHDSANDANKLSQLLSDRLAARGLDVRSTLLVSTDLTNEATKSKIRYTLAAIAASATPDDVFFLSFSGHGYSDPKSQFYILPSDVQGSCRGVDEQMLRSAISADELTEWLRPIDAGQMTFILDSCDSASSVEANGFKAGPMGSSGLGQLAYDKRMRILAASQPNQAARESDALQQGLLSYALSELGLAERKADWNPVDGKIMVGEWLGFAANAVPSILQSGAIQTQRGVIPVGEPQHTVPPVQTPAVFDFAKQDSFILQ